MRSLPRTCSLLLAALALSAPALAESVPFAYSLTADTKTVGSREATLNFLPGESGEVVTMQSWTEFSVTVSNVGYRYRQRLGGRFGGARSFSSSIDDNGHIREVQGLVDGAGRWSVTVVEDNAAKYYSLDANAIDLTSVELFDPDRALSVLSQVTALRVLMAETGAVLSGPVTALGPAEETLGDRKITLQRFRWSPPEGAMTLSYTSEGFLVAYETAYLGRKLGGRLRGDPPKRSFEEKIIDTMPNIGVQEEGLQ